jgi:hypothetical protein
MVASIVQVARRALLATTRAVAVALGMAMVCGRDSPDKDVVQTFRQLAPVPGDIVLGIPQRRYKSSCHSGNTIHGCLLVRSS